MQWLTSLFSDWLAWVPVIGGLAGLFGWAVGLPAVLKILASIVDILSPLLKALLELLVGFWRVVVWPDNPEQPSIRRGVRDILDDWVTLACVALLAWGIYTWGEHRVDRLTDDLGACQTEVVKLKKQYKIKPSNDFLWPFW